MSRRRFNTIQLCLAVALTTGCTSAAETKVTSGSPIGQAHTAAPGAPTPDGNTTTPVATQDPRGQSAEVAITFTRSGGIAGIVEHWTISLDGRVIGPAEEEASIPADEVSQLLAEIEAAGFFDWPPRPRSLESCADCFTYSITVEYQGRVNRITLVDGDTGAPDEAWTILERILGILDSVSE